MRNMKLQVELKRGLETRDFCQGVRAFVEEEFFLYSSRFFGGSNNQFDIRQINRRKTFNYIYVRVPQDNETQGQAGQ